jgi:two-component system OmpR family sensor kinase
MTLRARLTVLVAALVCGVAVLMGGAAVQVAYLTGLHSADQTLNAVAHTASTAQQDGVTSALYSATAQPQSVAVALLSPGVPATWLRLGDGIRIPDSVMNTAGRHGAESLDFGSAYRVLTAKLSDGDSVFLAVDISALQSERGTNLRIVLLISLLLALLGAASSRLLVRRDLNRIRELTGTADRIADGDLQATLPATVGISEVDELAGALGRMVSSLTTSFEELKTSHSQLRTFLGDVSHELRTPLTVVRGYVELLENHDDLDPELRSRAIARSMSEIERMQALIADLLLLAEFAERGEPRREEVQFGAMVRDGLIDLMSLQPERPVTAEIPAEAVVLVGDRRALESVCANLFGNIRRHTPDTAAVHVSLTVADDAAKLVVEDAGPGLTDAQYAVNLNDLERFNRMRSDTTGGSGLGLRIVATVVQMHHGSLQLSPSEMGGLRTVCLLPLRAE